MNLAKELEHRGAHVLAIKDMSSLLKPLAAHKLITALKQEIGIPVHLHTHDTSGNGGATLMMAAMAGVDIVDAAFSSMAGLTSQPSLNSLVAALENSERDTGLPLEGLDEISAYWEAVRPVYKQFESDLKTGTTEIYYYEMPGGQYSNFKSQVESFGLGHRFQEVKSMYKKVNLMLGDIVKVTPSSKVVGDLAIFMVQNDLTPENICEKAKTMDFPDSVVSYFEGMIGQPQGGFPKDLQKIVLKDKKPITCRPGELLPAEDFQAIKKYLDEKFDMDADGQQIMSYCMYPKVYEDYRTKLKKEGKLADMEESEEIKIEEGKELIVKLLEVKAANEDGEREVVFQVNGSIRSVMILDKTANTKASKESILVADPDNDLEVGANIPGTINKILVKEGDEVSAGQPVAVIEAMKMESNILAKIDGVVDKIFIKEGDQLIANQLVAKMKEDKQE